LSDRLKELAARVKEVSSSVHDLSHRLHPSKLEQLGLVAAVRSLCKEFADGRSLPIDFTHANVPHEIPEDVALCLYRIVQEGLSNVLKHSRARHVGVNLSTSQGVIVLGIYDDGSGFNVQTIQSGRGLGFVNIRERLHLVGGELEIDSAESGGGTRLSVRVPLAGPIAL
jgi:signal transduction histidine kinase